MPHAPKHKAPFVSPKLPKLPRVPKPPVDPEAAAIAAALAKASAKLASTLLKQLPLTQIRTFSIRNAKEMDEALKYYEEEGLMAVSVFESEALKKIFCERATMSIWNGTLRSCAYSLDVDCALPYINSEKDVAAMRGVFHGSPRAKQLLKSAGANPFPNVSFGAPSFGSSFNMLEACELRSNALLAELAQRAFGTDSKAYYTIDRPINKLPRQGGDEFLHVDNEPYTWSDTTRVKAQVMHGKMVVSDGGTFICCPKSHKQSDEITRLYQPLYPNASGMKFQLDPTKADPLDLYGRTCKYIIEAGTMVMWNSMLFHGVTENTSGRVQQGFYIGFQSDISRELYSSATGVDEVTDRYNSWRFGIAPKGYPSGDKVHLYPKAWKNYPKIMALYLAKVDHSSPRFDFSYREMATKKGVMTPDLKEIPDPGYIPQRLSQRAREMLVGEENVGRFDFSMA